ncbi:MAG: 2Fe-2S iron-sulfur cluster-binding protein [Granulosicoccus sp.]
MFHDLQVVDVHRTTSEAIVVSLEPPSDTDFSFIQGQYLTFRQQLNGVELRRSYSLCSAPHETNLRVAIKKVEGGAFSTWAHANLQVGETVQAMKPMGTFHTPLSPQQKRNYLGFAGGSGITPVLSIIKTVLQTEPASTFTLVYANRSVQTIMFREELEDLKNLHMKRLSVIHVLDGKAQEIDLFTGPIDKQRCTALFDQWIDVNVMDVAYICGPEKMMMDIKASLTEAGFEEKQIKFELFLSKQPGRLSQSLPANQSAAEKQSTTLTVIMDGNARSLTMPAHTTLLEAMLANALEAPYACRAGVCSTCRCKVVNGQVQMAANHALEDYEVEQGYTLACQAYPMTEDVSVDFEN